MSKPSQSLLFAAVLCVVCSLLLTAAASGLKDRQAANVALDRQKNLLKSVGLIDPSARYAPEEVERLYKENIRRTFVTEDGRLLAEEDPAAAGLPLYLHYEKGEIAAYIIPINTSGLWGKINGYLAIAADGATITGFTVYKHQETPGLGGEIEKAWFQKNFEGKKIVNQMGGFVSIGVAKGSVEALSNEEQPHYVDGISGATLTGKYLSAGLRDILKTYEPVSIAFRQNEMETVPAIDPQP